jgi:phage-related protein
MSNKVTSDISGFNPGTIVELFELDISFGTASSAVPKFRWFNGGHNSQLQEVVWQGNKYSGLPIEAEDFEFSGKGAIPRPTLTVANITSLLSGVINSYEDLVGSKVTRKKTFSKYLDNYCYTNGYPVGGVCTGESGAEASLSKDDCLDANKNGSAGTWTEYTQSTCEAAAGPGIWHPTALADSTAHFPDEIWYIDRKATETNTHIQFELSAAHDIHGVKLPSRTIIANTCPWVYKGVECGYSGSSYWNINNVSTTSANDVCSKTFTSCELRFPESVESPFGGFPGAGVRVGSVR